MKVFFAYGQLPELRKFSRAHRQLIYAECIVPMLTKYSQPVLRDVSAAALFVVLMLVLPGMTFGVAVQLGSLVIAILGAIGLAHLWSVAVISRHRKELQERIEPLVWGKMAGLDLFARRAGEVRPTRRAPEDRDS